jgi:hypothetical protein
MILARASPGRQRHGQNQEIKKYEFKINDLSHVEFPGSCASATSLWVVDRMFRAPGEVQIKLRESLLSWTNDEEFDITCLGGETLWLKANGKACRARNVRQLFDAHSKPIATLTEAHRALATTMKVEGPGFRFEVCPLYLF